MITRPVHRARIAGGDQRALVTHSDRRFGLQRLHRKALTARLQSQGPLTRRWTQAAISELSHKASITVACTTKVLQPSGCKARVSAPLAAKLRIAGLFAWSGLGRFGPFSPRRRAHCRLFRCRQAALQASRDLTTISVWWLHRPGAGSLRILRPRLRQQDPYLKAQATEP